MVGTETLLYRCRQIGSCSESKSPTLPADGQGSQTVHRQGAGRQVRKVASTETGFQLDTRIPPGHNTLLFQLTCSPGPALPEGWGSEPGPKRPGPSLPQSQKSYFITHSPFPGLVGPGVGARLSHRGRGKPIPAAASSVLANYSPEPLTIPEELPKLETRAVWPHFLPGPAVASLLFITWRPAPSCPGPP